MTVKQFHHEIHKHNTRKINHMVALEGTIDKILFIEQYGNNSFIGIYYTDINTFDHTTVAKWKIKYKNNKNATRSKSNNKDTDGHP